MAVSTSTDTSIFLPYREELREIIKEDIKDKFKDVSHEFGHYVEDRMTEILHKWKDHVFKEMKSGRFKTTIYSFLGSEKDQVSFSINKRMLEIMVEVFDKQAGFHSVEIQYGQHAYCNIISSDVFKGGNNTYYLKLSWTPVNPVYVDVMEESLFCLQG